MWSRSWGRIANFRFPIGPCSPLCSSIRRFLSTFRGNRFAAVWGNGDYGRLGHGTLESYSRPTPLASRAFEKEGLKSIACGGAHTLFLTESGKVYACGLNDCGQLGLSENKPYTTEPLEVASISKETAQISAGYHHSCAITVDGELYMWGKNSNGQLGLGKKAGNVIFVPTKVECLAGMVMKMVSLGSEHSIAITDEGDALSWGGGGYGRLGHGHKSRTFGFGGSRSEYTPRLIKDLEGLKVKRVAAGLLHSACMDENGSIFIFGDKTVQKLAFGERTNVTTPSMVNDLPRSVEVACGGYHTCAITSGGELYAWGSNENGCLGVGYVM
ncbi:hypothetical protein SAY86_023649 [Trapa natans]|uniref:RCC1-like domain-containing protein n=1 Tax=Trapa natans TaxID=22666 RepID=A0AAN7LXN2_TRANT|nr:hypothetical protein SAY86_023649 [Trapa natans]